MRHFKLLTAAVAALALIPVTVSGQNVSEVIQIGQDNIQSTIQEGQNWAKTAQIGLSNEASTNQSGSSFAVTTQLGENNSADTDQSGENNGSVIIQVGDDHTMTSTQTGNQGFGSVQVDSKDATGNWSGVGGNANVSITVLMEFNNP